ncbi:hypothetical protein FA048_17150 [Pedobacter polaris]|uniref:Uncharacterized protein n=1 Tax=Pedobacter polaris TaxID=2571273 RepID=A0A4U1CEH4_9SPHI|nr:hypothetical protein [Pedobacter polaris]TKC05456.1 hypothetical protein FA048_17150 [Pedobacter polaris]
MKYILLSLLTISLLSCVGPFGNKSIKVKIINESQVAISNVKLTTSENLDSLFFAYIESDAKESGNLNLEKNKTDGEYNLSFKQNGKYHIVKSGYYTNGRSLDYSMNIVVKNDTAFVSY